MKYVVYLSQKIEQTYTMGVDAPSEQEAKDKVAQLIKDKTKDGYAPDPDDLNLEPHEDGLIEELNVSCAFKIE